MVLSYGYGPWNRLQVEDSVHVSNWEHFADSC